MRQGVLELVWGKEIVILDRVVMENLPQKGIGEERYLGKSILGERAEVQKSLKLDHIFCVQRTAIWPRASGAESVRELEKIQWIPKSRKTSKAFTSYLTFTLSEWDATGGFELRSDNT